MLVCSLLYVHNLLESMPIHPELMVQLNEFLAGLNEYHSEVAEQALEHIHQKFQGLNLQENLFAEKLQTTSITDAAVFARISRVNMVIGGAHAVMANRGVGAPVGLHMVALAAKRHAVPFVVLTGAHKLCPLYPLNPLTLLNDMRCPSEILELGDLSDCLSGVAGGLELHVFNPSFDYIPPELVSLFITYTGGYTPSYVYKIGAEFYGPEDILLQ